jgi:hypothetical protein
MMVATQPVRLSVRQRSQEAISSFITDYDVMQNVSEVAAAAAAEAARGRPTL